MCLHYSMYVCMYVCMYVRVVGNVRQGNVSESEYTRTRHVYGSDQPAVSKTFQIGNLGTLPQRENNDKTSPGSALSVLLQRTRVTPTHTHIHLQYTNIHACTPLLLPPLLSLPICTPSLPTYLRTRTHTPLLLPHPIRRR